MTASIPHMETGTVLGGYRIDGVAGQGGMGVVYRATQLGLDRQVALKVIAAEFAENLDFRNRFKSEAQLAASIDHPNVVPIFETGESEGTLYLAMRYVEGTDLRTLVESQGGLDAERAVRIIWQVGAALDAAHRRGLVHRDVKPPNVLIAHEGEEHAYLTDFGLTKHAAAASAGFTRTGHFVGTPDFAAPEQIRGEQADARADVYALGALLFHTLTGRVPFPRDSELAKMYAHLNDPAPAASPLARPGTPTGLDVVIGTAMGKDPAERYESAGDLARAAWAALQGEVMPAPMGSVATGAAAEQAQPAPDTPAPRTPPPASIAPSLPNGAAAAPAPSVASSGAPVEPGKPAGPAGWPRGRRIALLLVLPLLLVGAIAVAALGVLGGDKEQDAGNAAAAQPPAQTEDPPAGQQAEGQGQARVVNTIKVGDGPDGIAADGKRIFVSHAKDGTLREIDADLDQVVGDPVKVGSNPDQIAAGKGTLWVVDASSNQLQRLQSEPALQPTATIPIGKNAQGISLGVQLAWVANTGDDTVQRIDRAQAQTVGDPIGVGDHPIGIFVGSKVWVTNFKDGTLSKIDIATAQVEGAPLETGAGARGVTEAFGGVWVSNLHDDTVTRVDPETFEVVAQIPVGKEPKELVQAFGSIWVVNSRSNTVTRIDPETNRVSGSPIPVGRNPIGITATKGAVWVTNFADDTVSAIK
jgi:serine/threonine-protein kinase